jgi:hypothetical protein
MTDSFILNAIDNRAGAAKFNKNWEEWPFGLAQRPAHGTIGIVSRETRALVFLP